MAGVCEVMHRETTAAKDYEKAAAHRKASKPPLYIGKLGRDRREAATRASFKPPKL
jgi:hypothetical protein